MKKWPLLIVLALALGGGAYWWIAKGRSQPLSEKNLTFAEVKRVTIRDVVSATGLVEPRELVFVGSVLPGTLEHLHKRIGDVVTEGTELAQLDDRSSRLKLAEAQNAILMAKAMVLQSQAAVKQAIANKDAAQVTLDFQMKLDKSIGFLTELEQSKLKLQAAYAGIDAAEAGVKAAEAKERAALTGLEEAKLAFDMTRLKVPGLSESKLRRQFLILDRKAHQGQMVGPQVGPLFVLAGSLEKVDVHAQVSEGDINRINEGMQAEFIITGFNDEDLKFPGIVRQKRPLASASPQAGGIKGAVYYDTVIEVTNRKDARTGEWQLRPGMTASLDIVRIEHKDVWKVPVGALNFTYDEGYQSDALKARLAEWKRRDDARNWRVLWTWDDAVRQAMPIFIRIDGTNKAGEIGLKDSEGNEILEWEPGKEPTGPLRVIIGAPPARAPGFFDQPANVKI